MSPAVQLAEVRHDRRVSLLVFALFVGGAALLCVGALLALFGFQACAAAAPDCSVGLRVAGPACAALGVGGLILARSRARLQRRQRRRRGAPADPGPAFACGESRQFAQCLVLGFLLLASGMLVSVLGVWAPGCGAAWAQEPLNDTDAAADEPPICRLPSLQILGPLVVLLGLCFFVGAHVKRRSGLGARPDGHDGHDGEEPPARSQSTEPVQVAVGDAVILFPPPPPPYFPEAPASAGTQAAGPSELPPSYHSLFSDRTPTPERHRAASSRDRESVYTISGTTSLSENPQPPHFASELPPSYEEKDTAVATSSPPTSRPSQP